MYSSDSDENSENELKNVLGSVLSGKMLAPSPAFQKALIGKYPSFFFFRIGEMKSAFDCFN